MITLYKTILGQLASKYTFNTHHKWAPFAVMAEQKKVLLL